MLAHQVSELPIFVYGTLMVGERNYIGILHDNLVKHEKASVKGELYYYRKEDYPALADGTHTVTGQLFYVKQLEQVFKPLDEIEGYLAPNHPENMYDRKILDVKTASGEIKKAYAYVINPRLLKQEGKEFTLMTPRCWKTFNQLQKTDK